MLGHLNPVQYIQRVHERPVVECNIVSGLRFSFNGGECLIVPKAARAGVLPVTYRIRTMIPYDDYLHECVLDGSDGSQLRFFVTTEDAEHNIEVAEKATATRLAA